MTEHSIAKNLLQRTARFFEAANPLPTAYLVGGSLRNLLLNEPCIDWDIAISGDVPTSARRLADALGGFYVHMHSKASRVVVKHEQLEMIFDLSPIQGEGIEADLRLRDFTLNAIAAPLIPIVDYLANHTNDALARFPFIDPLHGVADLQTRQLRAINDDSFRQDPLRLLRAVRLLSRYPLHIEPATEQLMRRDAALLPTVASERIHDELSLILTPNGATRQLRTLDAYGLLMTLFPEFIPARGMPQPRPHHWDVLQHSLETVGTLEQLVSALRDGPASSTLPLLAQSDQRLCTEIQALLDEAREQGFFQYANLTIPAMKLAAFLHDIGKPVTLTTDENGAVHFYNHQQAGIPLADAVMKRLSASTHDRRLAQLVTAHHMRPGQLGQDGNVTPRAIRRYFVDLGPSGISIALFSLADHLATYGPALDTRPPGAWERHLAVVHLLLTSYIRERERFLPPRLISAHELMRRLQLEPGPIIGRLLDQLAEAQAEGRVHSKEEALWLAREELLP